MEKTNQPLEEIIQYVELISGIDVLGINYIGEWKKVSSRDIEELGKIPKKYYAFRFFEITKIITSKKEVMYGEQR